MAPGEKKTMSLIWLYFVFTEPIAFLIIGIFLLTAAALMDDEKHLQ
jgi:hypothetical protein